jgi:hypothetical protein
LERGNVMCVPPRCGERESRGGGGGTQTLPPIFLVPPLTTRPRPPCRSRPISRGGRPWALCPRAACSAALSFRATGSLLRGASNHTFPGGAKIRARDVARPRVRTCATLFRHVYAVVYKSGCPDSVLLDRPESTGTRGCVSHSPSPHHVALFLQSRSRARSFSLLAASVFLRIGTICLIWLPSLLGLSGLKVFGEDEPHYITR